VSHRKTSGLVYSFAPQSRPGGGPDPRVSIGRSGWNGRPYG
jgi:hypothetical protein